MCYPVPCDGRPGVAGCREVRGELLGVENSHVFLYPPHPQRHHLLPSLPTVGQHQLMFLRETHTNKISSDHEQLSHLMHAYWAALRVLHRHSYTQIQVQALTHTNTDAGTIILGYVQL